MTNKEQHYDCLLAAITLKRAKERGNMGQYESLLFGFALKYSDLFKGLNRDKKFDFDRINLIQELTYILPDYFGNVFDSSLEVMDFYVS